MRIDGKGLADKMLTDLADLHLHPTLAVILVGDDSESLAYIRQKQKATERIGGKFILERLPKTTTQRELTARVEMYNRDNTINGLIVQRPIRGLTARVSPQKDVDGFEANSFFDVPIAMAVFKLLNGIDLQNKHIVIVGRGETAGKPIAAAFEKRHCATSIINSKTSNPKEIMNSADILISCVGKERVVTPDAVKPGAFLISVGLWRGSDNRLHGDYNEDEIKGVASYYTPTPGGIGPLNIACLMQNLVKAAGMKIL